MTTPCKFGSTGYCLNCGDSEQGECEGWNGPEQVKEADILEAAHRQCSTYKHSEHANLVTYTFNAATLIPFVRGLIGGKHD